MICSQQLFMSASFLFNFLSAFPAARKRKNFKRHPRQGETGTKGVGRSKTMGNPTRLVPDNQLILDAPLLKVPLELIRRNFKTAQRTIDKETKAITASLNEAAQKAQLGAASADETIASIDLMIKRMQTLKRKANALPSFDCSCR